MIRNRNRKSTARPKRTQTRESCCPFVAPVVPSAVELPRDWDGDFVDVATVVFGGDVVTSLVGMNSKVPFMTTVLFRIENMVLVSLTETVVVGSVELGLRDGDVDGGGERGGAGEGGPVFFFPNENGNGVELEFIRVNFRGGLAVHAMPGLPYLTVVLG